MLQLHAVRRRSPTKPRASLPRRRHASAPIAPTTSASRTSSSSTTQGGRAIVPRGAQLAPDLALARLNLAIALFYGGRPADAATEARAAATRLPDVAASALTCSASRSRAEDRLDEAIAAFARVLHLDPADAGAKIHLGQIHLQQRRYDEALQLFQEALVAEPYNVTAAYNVALALTRAGQPDEGRHGDAAVRSAPRQPYGVTYCADLPGAGRVRRSDRLDRRRARPRRSGAPRGDVRRRDRHDAAAGARHVGRAGRRRRHARSIADNDGDLDLVEVGATGARLLPQRQRRVFADETARAS